MAGRIIFIHGPSSSGKSTLGKALQQAIEAPFWRWSIDHLRDAKVLPSDRIRAGEFLWSEMRAPFFDGFHRSVAAFAEAGNDLILEHILDTPGWADELKARLAPFDVLFVGVHCDPAELRRREIARGDRPLGSAEKDFETVHVGRVYDIEVDGRSSVAENVRAVLERWRSGERRSEFAGRGR